MILPIRNRLCTIIYHHFTIFYKWFYHDLRIRNEGFPVRKKNHSEVAAFLFASANFLSGLGEDRRVCLWMWLMPTMMVMMMRMKLFRASEVHIRIYTGWWFGTFFVFTYIVNNNPNWLIFSRGLIPPIRYIIHGCHNQVCWLCNIGGQPDHGQLVEWFSSGQLDTISSSKIDSWLLSVDGKAYVICNINKFNILIYHIIHITYMCSDK